MVFLPDLSDGETSDGNFDENPTTEISENEDHLDSNQMHNFNTLETMSARSFGFIKPTQKTRENDMASRIRRHKSFFQPETSSITGKIIDFI